MRVICAVLFATTLLAPGASAGERVPSGAMPAGKPAGVHAAQGVATPVLIAIGLGVTGLGIAAIASGGKAGGCASGNSNTPCGGSTSTTGTAP